MILKTNGDSKTKTINNNFPRNYKYLSRSNTYIFGFISKLIKKNCKSN